MVVVTGMETVGFVGVNNVISIVVNGSIIKVVVIDIVVIDGGIATIAG